MKRTRFVGGFENISYEQGFIAYVWSFPDSHPDPGSNGREKHRKQRTCFPGFHPCRCEQFKGRIASHLALLQRRRTELCDHEEWPEVAGRTWLAQPATCLFSRA